MADIRQAAKWMREWELVVSPSMGGFELQEVAGEICDTDGDSYPLTVDELLAEDWQIVEII